MECGCSETAQTDIREWEKMYKNRYGHYFVEIPRDSKKARAYRLSLGELKEVLYHADNYKEIVRKMYPGFRGYGDRVDDLLVFFDTVCMDGRLKELRELIATKLI